MTPVQITFIGGPDTGDVGSASMGNAMTGEIHFPLNVPVTLDPDKERNGELRKFMEHVIGKLRHHKHFKVEDVPEGKPTAAKPAVIKHPVKAPPVKAKGKEAA